MATQFVRGNRVWVIDGTCVHKGYVSSVQVLTSETIYRVRMPWGGRGKLVSDCNVFGQEREACAELYGRLVRLAEDMRRRAGRLVPPPAVEAAPAPKPKPATIRVPAAFYRDHDERGCEPFCEPVKRTTRFVWLRADDPGLAELLDDAQHYSNFDHWGEWGSENRSTCRSAAATVRAIRDVIGWEGAEPAILRLRK